MRTSMFVFFLLVAFFIGCNNVNFMLNNQNIATAIREVTESEVKFRAENGRYGSLYELHQKGLVPKSLTEETYSGHKLEFSLTENGYTFTVTPLKYGSNAYSGTGNLSLYTDESRMVRGGDKQGAEATKNDPILERQ